MVGHAGANGKRKAGRMAGREAGWYHQRRCGEQACVRPGNGLFSLNPTEEPAMQARPRKKKVRRARFSRCPKCGKQIRKHQVRCRTCHQVQPR